jgi:hypothetical protein
MPKGREEPETMVGKRPSGRSEVMSERKASEIPRCEEVDFEAVNREVGRMKDEGKADLIRSGRSDADGEVGCKKM